LKERLLRSNWEKKSGIGGIVQINLKKKTGCVARCQWLTPVILATQEAEIRRIVIRSQPWQIILQDSISKKKDITKERVAGVTQVIGP
jgi:hypothetical protein